MRSVLLSGIESHFKMMAAVAATAVAGAIGTAEATVVYSGPVSINIPSTTAGVYLNVVTGVNNPNPALVPGWDVNPFSGGSLSFFNPTAPAGGVYVLNGGNVANLNPGDSIGVGSAYGSGAATASFVLNSTDNIVGFRFQNEAAGNATMYGWMRISIAGTFQGQPRSIVEYAYEDSGAPIAAGDVGKERLTTLFAQNNGFAGNTFDLSPTNPITLMGLEVNLGGPGSANTVSVYTKPGTSVGFETNAAAWTLQGSDTNVISAGINGRSPVNVLGLGMRPGLVYGVYPDLTAGGAGTMYYTNGAAGTVYSNADVTFTSNSGQTSPAFAGTIAGRIWNGTVKYKPTAVISRCTTTFAGGNGNSGTTFDLVGKDFVTVTGFNLNLNSTAGNVDTITVYARAGSCVGNENSAAGWTLVGTDTNVVSAGPGARSRVNVGGFSLSPGQIVGVYVDMPTVVQGSRYQSYTNLASGTVYEDAGLKIVSNTGQAPPAFTGGSFGPRAFNGDVLHVPTPIDGAVQTTFADNNQFAGNTFDVTSTRNVDVDGFDVNLSNAGTVSTVTIYWRNGTSVGHENVAGDWTLLGVDSAVLSNGASKPSPVQVGGLHLHAGQTYGIYVDATTYPTAAMRYTNAAAGTVSSDGSVSVTSNSGQVTPAFTGSLAGRQWNGRIYYHDTVCYANCDGSGASPILNVADFTCFLQKFAAGDPYANCDDSVAAPALNVADFTCYLQKYAAGCP